MPQNEVADQPRPQAHRLRVAGANAIRALTDFYAETDADARDVSFEWDQLVRMSQQKSDQWLSMLQEIAQLPVQKQDDETIAAAVIRYVQQLTEALEAAGQAKAVEEGKAASKVGDVCVAFRELCQKHNIATPCESFLGTEPGGTVCGKCGHPAVVHPWPQETQTSPPDGAPMPSAPEAAS